MITKNPMQLKAFIKNMAAEKHISPQLAMQSYMLERLLKRISLSKYKDNFILKGGFLIEAIVGIDTRATMDLDTTVKGFDLTHENIRVIFTEICAIPAADDVTFEMRGVSDIREGADYPGICVSLNANYKPTSVQLKIDVTTGDIITPHEVEYSLPMMFDDGRINIMAYNLETILAEKLEAILSRGIDNTRMRDYYDVYVLHTMHSDEYDADVLRQALERTSTQRGSKNILTNYQEIIEQARCDKHLHELWVNYQKDKEYAHGIAFEDTCEAVEDMMEEIS